MTACQHSEVKTLSMIDAYGEYEWCVRCGSWRERHDWNEDPQAWSEWTSPAILVELNWWNEYLHIAESDEDCDVMERLFKLETAQVSHLETELARVKADLEIAESRKSGAIRDLYERSTSCPCHWTEPCHPDCTCVNQFSSRGCERCCSYGSNEQRRAQAEWLADRLSKTEVTK